MRNTPGKLHITVRGMVLAGIVSVLAPAALAQAAATGILKGKVLDASGAPVANATVTATTVDTGQGRTATSGSDGAYQFPTLTPGNYRVRFEAAGFKALEIPSATVDASREAVLDGKLDAGAQTPSLKDLGFSPDQAQGSAQDQARLDKRSHMLKIHQRLGLITAAPMIATLFAANGAASRNSSASGRELHAALGSVTAGMYLTTAYFAIAAPRIEGTKTRGPITVHKALAWIHGSGMILTPILGALAYQQRSSGQKVHGIASAHGAVAGITAAAYGAAILSVTIKF